LKETEVLIQKYYLGTSKYWKGATLFWQIDKEGKIRTGKVIQYDINSGKRNRKNTPPVNWIHAIGSFKNKNHKASQCLFGEHLLKTEPYKNIAIVESEKTALIASFYIPENNWLATGSISNLKKELFEPLKGKYVTLYPDAGAYEIWKKKAEQLKDIAKISISNLIETRATKEQIEKGFDLADYLIKDNLKFTSAIDIEHTENNNSINIDSIDSYNADDTSDNLYKELQQALKNKDQSLKSKISNDSYNSQNTSKKKESWNIQELEKFFDNIILPDEPIKIGTSKINNISNFIDSHLNIVKKNNGNPTYKTYLERVYSLKENLKKGGMA
jgi:hypothetical protein